METTYLDQEVKQITKYSLSKQDVPMLETQGTLERLCKLKELAIKELTRIGGNRKTALRTLLMASNEYIKSHYGTEAYLYRLEYKKAHSHLLKCLRMLPQGMILSKGNPQVPVLTQEGIEAERKKYAEKHFPEKPEIISKEEWEKQK